MVHTMVLDILTQEVAHGLLRATRKTLMLVASCTLLMRLFLSHQLPQS